MKNTFLLISILFLTIILFSNCSKEDFVDDRLPFEETINPTLQPSLLSRAISLDGKNVTGSFNLNLEEKFTHMIQDNNIQITSSIQSASITNDNILFLPFIVDDSDKIAGIYLQIKGADNYWKVSLTPKNNILLVSINVPDNINVGSFTIVYYIYDHNGNISSPGQMDVMIESNIDSCSDNQEGNDGLTIRSYDMGDESGKIIIDYDTYSIPDRIDIRYNNQWIASTGDLLNNINPTPPLKNCNDVIPSDGFVGASGQFVINYDPSISRKLDIYVSGCMNSGTAWDYRIYCPK